MQIGIRVEANLHYFSEPVFSGPKPGSGSPPSSGNEKSFIKLFHLLGSLVLQKGSKILLYIFL